MTWFGTANSGEFLVSTDDDGLYKFGELTGDVTGTLGATKTIGLNGFAIPTGAPQTDQILKFDGSEWAYTPDASGGGLVSHALLGAFHSDAASHPPVRGDIITAQGSGTPLWDALGLGTAEFVIYSDGTDVVYTRLGPNTPFEKGAEAAPSMTFTGELGTGWSNAASGVMIGSALGVGLLELDGVDGQLVFNAGQVMKTRSGGSTTLLENDYVYMVTSTPALVSLPAAPEEGAEYIVKDRDGLASGANQITVGGNGNTIDGNASVKIRQKYGSLTLLYSGTEWNII